MNGEALNDRRGDLVHAHDLHGNTVCPVAADDLVESGYCRHVPEMRLADVDAHAGLALGAEIEGPDEGIGRGEEDLDGDVIAYRAGLTVDVEHDRGDLADGRKLQCPLLFSGRSEMICRTFMAMSSRSGSDGPTTFAAHRSQANTIWRRKPPRRWLMLSIRFLVRRRSR